MLSRMVNFADNVPPETRRVLQRIWEELQEETSDIRRILEVARIPTVVGGTGGGGGGSSLPAVRAAFLGTPYTGSVIRTLNDKLGEYPSVLDFGAVGDGVNNDTAAFQAALASNTETLIIPGGNHVFVISDTLVVNRSGMRIVGWGGLDAGTSGPGSARIKLAAATNKKLLYVENAIYVHLEGLNLDGNLATGSNPILHVRNGAYANILSCQVHDGSQDGILIENFNASSLADEVNIINCKVFTNSRYGVRFDYAGVVQGMGDWLLKDCHINYNSDSGVYVHGGSAWLIKDNNILTNGNNGIEVVSIHTVVEANRGIISGNQVRNNFGSGLYIHSDDSTPNLGSEFVVVSNQFHFNNGSSGTSNNVDIFDCDRLVFIGNYCGDKDFTPRSLYPLQLARVTNATLIGNNFTGCVNANPLIATTSYMAYGNLNLADRVTNNLQADAFIAINQAIDVAYRLAITGNSQIIGDFRVRSSSLARLFMNISGTDYGKLLSDASFVYLRNTSDRGLAIDQNNPSTMVVDDNLQCTRLAVGTAIDLAFAIAVAGDTGFSGHLLPTTPSTYDIGGSGNHFANAYINLIITATSGGITPVTAGGVCGQVGAEWDEVNTTDLNAIGASILSGSAKLSGTVGFFGTAPTTQPTVTGARDDPEAALANLLIALAGLGLIVDSTTAT